MLASLMRITITSFSAPDSAIVCYITVSRTLMLGYISVVVVDAMLASSSLLSCA